LGTVENTSGLGWRTVEDEGRKPVRQEPVIQRRKGQCLISFVQQTLGLGTIKQIEPTMNIP
jgi:hypothetical protein